LIYYRAGYSEDYYLNDNSADVENENLAQEKNEEKTENTKWDLEKWKIREIME
jgi:hypothetical protein